MKKTKLTLKRNTLFMFSNQSREGVQQGSTLPTTTTITGTTTGIDYRGKKENFQTKN